MNELKISEVLDCVGDSFVNWTWHRMIEKTALEWKRRDKMKIYIAHPITGLLPEEVTSYYRQIQDRMKLRWEVLSPMVGKGEFRPDQPFKPEGYSNPIAGNHAIFERDQWMVRQADVVFVDLENTEKVKTYTGCTMELAWASLLGKHTVVVLPKESALRHAFVIEAADIIFETFAEAMTYLAQLSDSFRSSQKIQAL